MDAEALPDDDGDDAGPSALLRAAAELIVNEAEQGLVFCSRLGAVIRPS